MTPLVTKKPETLGERDEQREEHEDAADSDLGRRVLKAEERLRKPHPALDSDQDQREQADQQAEAAEQDELRAEAARLAGEEE